MGRVMFGGGKINMSAPAPSILASKLAVGSSVYLMENGVATEYLVVNQGKPSGSSLYDDSCDGLWLLRKDIKQNRQWHSSAVNDYKNSTIHAWLNGDFFNQFRTVEQEAIKQVKIPYVNGTGTSAVASGSNGLSANIFLLGGYELGITTANNSYFPVDGAKLSYFLSGLSTEAQNLRIGYLNGSIGAWWLRSPGNNSKTDSWVIGSALSYGTCSTLNGVRPALVLPSTTLFDGTTHILKGVA